MGFCLLNNVAIAADAALRGGARAGAIVDWDVHHGNGTQDIFWTDDRVLFISLHECPALPGQRRARSERRGTGGASTVNCPLPRRSATDAVYRLAFERGGAAGAAALRPGACPGLGGFDAHARDPLASMQLTERGYAGMARPCARSPRDGGGRLGLVLEGGYDLYGADPVSVRALSRSADRTARRFSAEAVADRDAVPTIAATRDALTLPVHLAASPLIAATLAIIRPEPGAPGALAPGPRSAAVPRAAGADLPGRVALAGRADRRADGQPRPAPGAPLCTCAPSTQGALVHHRADALPVGPASDGALHAGIVLGVALRPARPCSGWRPRLCFALGTALYLSYAVACRTSSASSGTTCCSSAACSRRSSRAIGARRWAHLLLRVLLFKLYWESGLAKWQSPLHDWQDGSAMTFYYETAPLPARLAWYAHALPAWWHHLESWFTLFFELVVPFAIFAPRRLRLAAAAVFTGFQVVNIATANYGFFAYLAMALHVFLLDEPTWSAARAPRSARPGARPRALRRAGSRCASPRVVRRGPAWPGSPARSPPRRGGYLGASLADASMHFGPRAASLRRRLREASRRSGW